MENMNKEKKKDCFCAISTPLGHGAISIVRMSGEGSLDIMKRVFSSKSLNYENITNRLLYLGNFDLGDNINEHCLAVYFKKPMSYTGEDMVEFQIHGGTIITQKVLEILIKNGARLAENGEFTRTAFENGKISLDMAESIIGEINAESESELKASLSLAQGKLSQKIRDLQDCLTENIAEIEATLDYPEEDFEDMVKEKIFATITDVKGEIKDFLKDAQNSKYIKNGINIALVGATNVGKSSTLNALIGENRAIVTEIEGTTRDSLTESTEYNGIRLNFIDTAGIRKSNDKVENIGIERSKQQLELADVVLHILDGSRDLSEFDKDIISLLNGKNNVVTIINKSDLPRKLEKFPNEIEISALKEINVDEIKKRIFDMVVSEQIDYNKVIVTSNRQIENLNNALNICEEIEQRKSFSMDIIAMLIKKLWNELGKITGQCENESIIDLIFSKFCLGK
jgi:tRNA modification GTPase